jgi:hypothetical protein
MNTSSEAQSGISARLAGSVTAGLYVLSAVAFGFGLQLEPHNPYTWWWGVIGYSALFLISVGILSLGNNGGLHRLGPALRTAMVALPAINGVAIIVLTLITLGLGVGSAAIISATASSALCPPGPCGAIPAAASKEACS